jgi:hypothetical protein
MCRLTRHLSAVADRRGDGALLVALTNRWNCSFGGQLEMA